ncbi:MAG: ATP-binding protein [Acidobacteriaceae bacterium]
MTLALPKEQATFICARLSAAAYRNSGAAEAVHLAHDAHNWLTVLQLYCDLLRTSGVVAGNGQKLIDELSSAVERGHGLVDSLLDSVQSAGPVHRDPPEEVAPIAPLTLAAAIERRLPLLRAMAGSRIQVEIKTVAQSGSTALKELEFERILLNLVRNAIEAMPEGGRLRIVLESGHSSDRRSLVLRVSDTGNGISPELLPHIFDSSVSTKLISTDPPLSRGFGLAIVRALALGAGGSVRVRSRIGRGTSFAIGLPLLSDPLNPAPRPRARTWTCVRDAEAEAGPLPSTQQL